MGGRWFQGHGGALNHLGTPMSFGVFWREILAAEAKDRWFLSSPQILHFTSLEISSRFPGVTSGHPQQKKNPNFTLKTLGIPPEKKKKNMW